MENMKSSKNKGIALIELIVTLSIIVILSSIGFSTYYKIYKNIDNSCKVNMCKNGILHVINDAKHYCKINCKEGYLIIESKENISFYDMNSRIKTYKVPDGLRLGSINTGRNQRIFIDNFGNTSDACTIHFYDLNKKNHSITIRVGTNYGQIK